MKTFTSIVGWIFLVCVVLGATVKNLHFHVVFADSVTTMKFHQRQADTIRKELADKEEP